MLRTGLIAQKIGMTRLFGEDGSHIPVTVLQVEKCEVVAVRTAEKDGYTAVQLGVGTAQGEERDPADARPFRQGEGRAEGGGRRVPGRPRTRCSRSVPRSMSAISSPASSSTSPASASARASPARMKRHNFGGLRASHGVSISHRSHGSTGNRQDPGRMFKDKKMAGHMGHRQVTVQNLEVFGVDPDRGLILVKGGVPGPRGGYVRVTDAVKSALPKEAPYPGRRRAPGEALEAVVVEEGGA